jgi:hypothetical protein
MAEHALLTNSLLSVTSTDNALSWHNLKAETADSTIYLSIKECISIPASYAMKSIIINTQEG